ncbi:MAG: TerB family tellurite resistance protein [Ardenticatenaceae bacterium]|nr:TerB family tellurite resistance protein [Ardenticatenaceae bacterium]
MADRSLILTLAKVLIAAAWVDGEVTQDEINSAKDLLFHLPHTAANAPGMRLTSREWSILEMYVESPVDAAERARLVSELQTALRTPEDKALVLDMLEEVVRADGAVSPEETAVLAEIKESIDQADTGLMGKLSRLFGGAVERRSEAAQGPNRELFYDDFVQNRVFYSVNQRLQAEGKSLSLDDGDLRKYSLAGALMAKVAQTDRTVTDAEFEAMAEALQERWDVARETAVFITEVAVSQTSATQDMYRMQREFASLTSETERERFIEVLFLVAAADDQVSFEETEEIRLLANGLNLSHSQFIAAKLAAAGQSAP